MNPVEGTFVGRHEFDPELPRFDAASLREYAAALRAYTSSLEEAEAASLDDEIDRTATLHAARHDLLVLEREKPHARNPSHALLTALNGIHLLLVRESGDASRRAAALVSRVQALPRFLDEAATALTEPRAVFLDTARAMIAGGVALLRDGLAKSTLVIADPMALSAARDAGIDALHRYGDALALMEPTDEEGPGIGRELFDLKLHTAHMIGENADELLRFGERLRAEATAELEHLGAELRPGVAWRDIVRDLREDAPTRDTAIDEYRGAMQAAHDFTVERALVTVPDGELVVAPTPEFLRSLIPFAAYQVRLLSAVMGTEFFVTLPKPNEPWRLHCRAELPSTALHEGIPGHHLQIVTACHRRAAVRRVLASPAAQEGWALYCENLMSSRDSSVIPRALSFRYTTSSGARCE